MHMYMYVCLCVWGMCGARTSGSEAAGIKLLPHVDNIAKSRANFLGNW